MIHLPTHTSVSCVGPKGTTLQAYSSVRRNQWRGFLQAAVWEKLDEANELFLTLEDGAWVPNYNTFQRFAFYLLDIRVGKSTFKTCLAWLWNTLNDHLLKKGLATKEEGYILRIPGVHAP